jgi:leucyl/phenylalanyl-tRNA--protein transferase
MFRLPDDKIAFPPVNLANKDGLLAVGGDLSYERLTLAYKNGIFPWYNEGDEILWWAPDPRMVLFPAEVHISKTMRSLIRKNIYTITENKAFEKVIDYCAETHRKKDAGTWLSDEMKQAYIDLYKKNKAFSVEVWNKEGKLVGGLYAVISAEKVLSGESMFHLEPNTSKLAFIHLAQKSLKNNIKVIDCQIYTKHLESLGAREIPRSDFIRFLQ